MLQVLKILRRKDELIGMLQSQLEESTQKLQTLQDKASIEAQSLHSSEGRSKDYWTQRDARPTSNSGDVDQLRSSLQDSQHSLRQEKELHEHCKAQLKETLSALQQYRQSGPGAPDFHRRTIDGESGREQFQQELRGLREKTLDQAEQIQVRC